MAPPRQIALPFKPIGTNGAPAVVRKTKLSDAARLAIVEAKDEPAAKRAKVTVATATKVATITTLASGQAFGVQSSRATTKEELRKKLEGKLPLLELELETMGEDWLLALQDELTKPYFLKLKQFIVDEQKSHKVFPPAADIYSWTRYCPLKDVRVVIVGQDPYHDDGQAHGLAFSVRKGVRVPPSLRNMYKELGQSIPGFVVPPDGDLTKWAEHGILLLNTSLTVRAHQAGSHSKQGWEQFTAAALKVVTDRLADSKQTPGANGIVIMAWGAHAAKMLTGLNLKQHLVLKSAHPSPLSASRGFFGNGHFTKSDEWLKQRYGVEHGIDWKSLGAPL